MALNSVLGRLGFAKRYLYKVVAIGSKGRRNGRHRAVCAEDGPPINEVSLCGPLCRTPLYRRTPLGREICVVRGEEKRYGTAVTVEDDGALLVRYADGTTQTVASGEVSIRGMYGYL